MTDDLTHINSRGEAHMVDVGEKQVTRRKAIAEGVIEMQSATLDRIRDASHKKGDVLAVARIAGIQAAKRTSELIPLCHAIPISHLDIEFELQQAAVKCISTVTTDAKTGVEMEALVAVQNALLTIYDMCKAVDRGMIMHSICLISKQGGVSGDWSRGQSGENS